MPRPLHSIRFLLLRLKDNKQVPIPSSLELGIYSFVEAYRSRTLVVLGRRLTMPEPDEFAIALLVLSFLGETFFRFFLLLTFGGKNSSYTKS